MKPRTLAAIFLALVVVIAGGWWWQSRVEAGSDAGLLEATGTIEARRVSLAPEIGGRVEVVAVEEGERVTAGTTLVRLDDTLLRTQRDQTQAALRAAQANLSLLRAGATEEQIQAAEAQLAQAEASLRAARANLAALTATSRPEEIAAIQSSLQRARARYDEMTVVFTADQVEKVRLALTTAVGNLSQANARQTDLAKDTRNPSFVLAAATAAVADAQEAVDAAQQAYAALQDDAKPYVVQRQLVRVSWEVARFNLAQAQARLDGLTDDPRTTPDALDAAQATLRDAQEQVNVTKDAYDALTTGMSALQLNAVWAEMQREQALMASFGRPGGNADGAPTLSVEALLAQIDALTAARAAAAANLAALRKGARPQEIEAAQAQVDAAQAQLDALDVQLAKYTLTAPWDGVVLVRSAEPGQMAMPGTTLLEIGRLDRLELTVYLPEDRFGQVTPGQAARVQVDAYPGRTFPGTVLRVADEAEFTPTNVQTKEDRTRLVYAVVIGLENPDLALKPGMIADVTFGE